MLERDLRKIQALVTRPERMHLVQTRMLLSALVDSTRPYPSGPENKAVYLIHVRKISVTRREEAHWYNKHPLVYCVFTLKVDVWDTRTRQKRLSFEAAAESTRNSIPEQLRGNDFMRNIAIQVTDRAARYLMTGDLSP